MYTIKKLRDDPALLDAAARWFHEKWGIDEAAYRESMEACLKGGAPVPQWYVCLEGGRILGGMGVIENDFHDRKDLAPNVCAVYTEEDCRGRGIAGALLDAVCEDMASLGVGTLYLLTDHDRFYERYGWEFYCMAQGDGEEQPARLYRKITGEKTLAIRYALPEDEDVLAAHDPHIAPGELAESIRRRWVLTMWEGDALVGWLRFNLFWDNTPFMNMLYMLEGRRGQGLGGRLTAFWEREMKAAGYRSVLTSTQSNEDAQHFYRAHGYKDCGSLLLPGEPLEIIFIKEL